jgi:hypothetical protein
MECDLVNLYNRYSIDKEKYNRFDQRDIVFSKVYNDKSVPFYGMDFYDNVEKICDEGKEGYSRMDFARIRGAWSVYDNFNEAFGKAWGKDVNAVAGLEKAVKFAPPDKNTMTLELKKTAQLYGAFKTGITRYDKNWVYSHNIRGKQIDLGDDYQHAIVVLVAMNPHEIQKSPTFEASIETGSAYSRLAFIVACLAGFIRNLGFKALSMGNDTALSIPLAIDAGLGELGRNGLLITPEMGPCVRIGKIFTDMPLEHDTPIDTGLTELCKSCRKCADECENDAISKEKEPSHTIQCGSNNKEIKRWAVNHYKCYEFWCENGSECSTCISVCPAFQKALKNFKR